MTRAFHALTGNDPISTRLRLLGAELLGTGGVCAVCWMAGQLAKKGMK